MTWKFKKTKNYEKMKVFKEIESDLIPEAYERNLFDIPETIS